MNILDPQGPVAAAEKTILIDSLAIMLAIVVPTIVAIFAFAFWFRASNTRAFYWPDWEYSGRIEMVVWSIPALTVILLSGVAWIGSHQLDPAAPVEGTGSRSGSRPCRSTGNGCSSIRTRGLPPSTR
jgi:cytochrome o ubiquinol oxidase subunit 2